MAIAISRTAETDAALFSERDRASAPTAAQLAGEPAYVHQVPGRLRLEWPRLRRDPLMLQAVCEGLRATGEAESVEGNALLGSVTIRYDAQKDPRPLLQACGLDRSRADGPAAAACRCGRGQAGSSWTAAATAGVAAHLLFDLVVWGTAAGALASR